MINVLPRDIRTAPFGLLAGKTRPVDARLPEALPYVLYDTQTYPAAGIAQLDFFQVVNADKTLSNIEQGATLPAPQFFDIHRIFIDSLSPPTATTADTAVGIENDYEIIFRSGRATFTLTTASKTLGPMPGTYLGASGIFRTAFGSGRAAAAGAIIQQVGGIENGGFPVNGSITLPPTQSFKLSLNFVPAIAIAANMLLRVSFLGILYRKVG